MGVVYFLQANDGPVKIGYATSEANVAQRLRAAQTGHPARLQVRQVLPGDPAFEAELHRYFADDRIFGEWFRPSSRLTAYMNGGWQTALDLRDQHDIQAIREIPYERPPRFGWAYWICALLLGGLVASRLPRELQDAAIMLVLALAAVFAVVTSRKGRRTHAWARLWPNARPSGNAPRSSPR